MNSTKENMSPVSRLLSHPIAPKRIVVIRLDRIGDVVLSTPVLQALRHQYPHAFLAMMVRPACEDVVRGNPYLNEAILYEKEGAHRSMMGTIRFARRLRRYEFDTALVLHPSNRSHWIPWLAGIPVRIGYGRKCGWLLTHRVPHRKQEGQQHEAVYTLELLAVLGLTLPMDPRPTIALSPRANQRIEVLLSAASVSVTEPGDPAEGGEGEAGRPPRPAFRVRPDGERSRNPAAEGGGRTDRLIAIHPSASCVSKRWMPQRFAQVADRLIAQQGVRVCVVASASDTPHANQMVQAMTQPVLNVAGLLSIAELAALLHRCRLLISNDSGPVHIAAAVGTPVVDIFGRNQRGLSPLRWGPLGEGHVILHHEVGCVTCLAHNCDIDFLCLTSLSVDEVYQAACSILQRP